MENKVVDYFKKHGLEDRIYIFKEGESATVDLAAQALECSAESIAKSITFKIEDRTILVVASGSGKIDNKKYKAKFNAKAKMLSREEVIQRVGFDVGGVCPFLVNEGVEVYLDESLRKLDKIYPACGSDGACIALNLNELMEFSGFIEWIDVCKTN